MCETWMRLFQADIRELFEYATMVPDVRPEGDKPCRRVAERIEDQARAIREGVEQHGISDISVTARTLLERQVAIASEQLDDEKRMHREMLSEIGMTERKLSKELHDHRYSHWRVIDSLKQKVLALQAERRRHVLGHETRLQQAHGRLFALISEHAYLKHNGHNDSHRET